MNRAWAALLLTDRSPSLRLRVLRELLERDGDDFEVRELEELRLQDPLLLSLLAGQSENGAWSAQSGYSSRGEMPGTAQALLRLDALGLDKALPAVRRGAEYLFAQQNEDGSWPPVRVREQGDQYSSYDTIPLQTAMPLRGLAAVGYATDARAERAYQWLLDQRLEDGSWPTGTASGVFGRVADYRRLSFSRWGCRSNTTGALICLAYHPERRRSSEAQLALDHLLSSQSHQRHDLGFEVARTLGAEKASGLFTYFARFDMALLLDLSWRVGASPKGEQLASLVKHVRSLQGDLGLWEYLPKPQMSRWLTFDLLRSFSRLGL